MLGFFYDLQVFYEIMHDNKVQIQGFAAQGTSNMSYHNSAQTVIIPCRQGGKVYIRRQSQGRRQRLGNYSSFSGYLITNKTKPDST